MIICLLSWWLRIVLVKKKKKCVSIIWGLKNHLLTLDNYLLSCGGNSGRVSGGGGSGSGSDYGDGGRVGGGNSGGGGSGNSGGGDSGNSSSCGWLWLLFIIVDILFIVVDILFYCSRYIILLWCLYYFIVLKAKIDPLLQYVL